jgi:hypothetical protein
MNKLLIPLAITALVVVLFFALMPEPKPLNTAQQSAIGLPWQITSTVSTSTVFGLTLGQSSLGSAIEKFGNSYEAAILAKKDQPGALELFYNDFKAGPIMGKLIVVADLPVEEVQAMRSNAAREEYVETGNKKVMLKPGQLELVKHYAIRSIVLAPSVRLSDEIVRQRFGEPEQVLQESEQLSHYLYPHKGLHIVVNDNGKDLLEYVSPDRFAGLINSLPMNATGDGI